MANVRGGLGDAISGIIGGPSQKNVNIIEDQAKKLTEVLSRAGKKAAKDVVEYTEALESKKKKIQQEDDKKFRLSMLKLEAEETNNLFKKITKNLQAAMLDLGNTVNKIVNNFSGGINAYITKYNQYLSSFSTRLYGTSLSTSNIVANISKNLGTSPYLKQEEMMNNVSKFIESGVAYNLELRSYVATATNKIAATFNAFDSSLLRLIRIQQADSTVARLGMESLLTKFLNQYFEDTSYLSTVGTGNITGSLLEAESLMGYKGAAEFDYAVQKWLGSMTALGVSSNTVNTLAQGLGYLGSGNVSAITGNTALQNLLVMATGGKFGELLTGGLNAQSASSILQNIVNFGKNIAGSGNNVVMSQFANLFGLNISDIVSLTNITSENIKKITEDIVTYEQLRDETTNRLATMSQRTTPGEMVANVLANMQTSLGANIASNPVALGIWTVANLMSDSGLDIPIPVPLVGSLSTANLMKLGVVGTGAITSLSNIASAIGSGNLAGTNISAWTDTVERGKGLGVNGVSSGRGLSGSAYIGAYDSENTKAGFSQVESQAEEYTGAKTDEITELIRDHIAPDVSGIKTILESWDLNYFRLKGLLPV